MPTTLNPHPSTRVIDAFPGPVRYRPEPLNLARGTERGQFEEMAGHLYAAAKLAESLMRASPRYKHGIVAKIARDAAIDAGIAEGAARWLPCKRECA